MCDHIAACIAHPLGTLETALDPTLLHIQQRELRLAK